jgi:hypothetical protein
VIYFPSCSPKIVEDGHCDRVQDEVLVDGVENDWESRGYFRKENKMGGTKRTWASRFINRIFPFFLPVRPEIRLAR